MLLSVSLQQTGGVLRPMNWVHMLQQLVLNIPSIRVDNRNQHLTNEWLPFFGRWLRYYAVVYEILDLRVYHWLKWPLKVTKWKVIGNDSMMGHTWVPISVQEYLWMAIAFKHSGSVTSAHETYVAVLMLRQ